MLCLFSFTILQNDENIFKQSLICKKGTHGRLSPIYGTPL